MTQEQHPVEVTIPKPERSSRWLALALLLFAIPKMIILIPHIIIMYVLGIVVFVLTVLAQIAVLITGRYPAGMHDIVSGVVRWQTRVNVYFLGLTDTYPPFSLK